MSRKLLLLDIVLVAVVILAGVQWRNAWKASKQREAARLNKPLPPLPAPRVSPLPAEDPVIATKYAQVAQKMLFDPSRNPTVVVEKPAPPPPPPPPPMPAYRGAMNLGDGLVALFRVPGQPGLQSIHMGENAGQYKLVDINSEGTTLEWNGQKFYSSVSQAPVVQANDNADAGSARTAGPAAPPPPPAPVLKGPGEDTGRGFRNCTMNDGQPEGTVIDGYRKVVYTTPFGPACRYEPVK